MNTLPHGGLALAGLEEQLLLPGVKGLPITAPLRQGAIGVQGWNVLRADTSFPVAMLKSSALRHNLDWMRRFCAQYGATLAPHGKTTMSPQLFGAQLANGAWGITLASATQVQVAHRFGVRRVLLANQLVARADIHSVLQLMHDDPDFEFFALVDSLEGVARLAAAVAAHPLARPLPLLVELGLPGKRAGCRSDAEAMAAGARGGRGARPAAGRHRRLRRPAGVGRPRRRRAAVDAFVARLAALVRAADADSCSGARADPAVGRRLRLFRPGRARLRRRRRPSRPVLPVLRSGCYLTSDHGSYLRQIGDLDAREAGHAALGGEGLRPALEVWSMVQSRPEPQLAILTMGKRDASYDIDLPIPLCSHRPGPGAPSALPPGCSIVKMNDQHAYLQLPAGFELAVGDLVGCGISHPCTTFDKWPLLLAVDDDYGVRYAINTFF